MSTSSLLINHASGLHARPAADFVQLARQFKCDIHIDLNGQVANGKSILDVLSLGINQGTVITLFANGEDAEKALEILNKWNSG